MGQDNPKVFQCISNYILKKEKYFPPAVSFLQYAKLPPLFRRKNTEIDYFGRITINDKEVEKLIKNTVSEINKFVKEDGELVDGYGYYDYGTMTPLMLAVTFKGIDIEVVEALLENGANVNLTDLRPMNPFRLADDWIRKNLLIDAAENSAYMGQEIMRGGVLFTRPDVNIKLCDNKNKSILAYILSNYNGYVESVKELVYKVITEDEEKVSNIYVDLINEIGKEIGKVTLDDVEKCLMNTAEKGAQLCIYSQFLDKHIKQIRKYEIDYEERKNNITKPEQTDAEYEAEKEKENKIDLFVTAEARKLIYDFIDKFLDHEDIVYIINLEWKGDVSCLGLLLDFYGKDNSDITLKLIEKCLKKGADVNKVLYKIFDFDDPLKILKILKIFNTSGGVDVNTRILIQRPCVEAIEDRKKDFPRPHDNFLTYTLIKLLSTVHPDQKQSQLPSYIKVFQFILDKLGKLYELGDRDKVVNCILSPNYYNTTSITAAMHFFDDQDQNDSLKELYEELENFLGTYMKYDRRILIHGFKYAVESGNINLFEMCMRVKSLSFDDITKLLEGMEILDSIQKVIDALPGGPDAINAKNSYKRNAEAQAESNKRKRFGAEKRRSNRRKVQLAPTRKRVVKRRSLKKKCHA